jgi:hypothetical protein
MNRSRLSRCIRILPSEDVVKAEIQRLNRELLTLRRLRKLIQNDAVEPGRSARDIETATAGKREVR